MKMLPCRRSPQRRLWAIGLFVALVAQMELPALHAVETTWPAVESAPADGPAGDFIGREITVARSAPAHDPAGCPVCQSLHRTNPVVSAPACGEPLPTDANAALAALDPRPEPTAAHSGHPPRAPPAHPIQLA